MSERFRSRAVRSLVLGLGGLLASVAARPLGAQVTTATLTLTPGNNAFTLSGTLRGTLAGIPFTVNSVPQATGSNVTQWTGTITVELDRPVNPTTVRVVSADLTAQDSGSWSPGVNGVSGTAPANYGLLFSRLGFSLVTAVRDARATFYSSALALAGSGGSYTFSPTGTTLEVTAGAADYQSSTGNVGRASLAGVAPANAATTNATLGAAGYALSAQIPVDVSVPLTLDTTGTGTFRLVGVIRASGLVPAPPMLVDVSTEAAGKRVRWREVIPGAQYRAQFSDDLTAGWQDFAGSLAADGGGIIDLLDPAAPARRFYRLVTPP